MSRAVPFLIVDDRPGNLMVVESILEPDQYALVMVQSEEKALLAMLKTDFAAVLLDVKMPEMDGYELAEMIRGRKCSRHLPIIFVSAHLTDPADARRGYEVGAVDYLCKPVNSKALRTKVAVFAELYRERQDLLDEVANLRQLLRDAPSSGDGSALPRH
jgi:CheY-like chemotaxis protein